MPRLYCLFFTNIHVRYHAVITKGPDVLKIIKMLSLIIRKMYQEAIYVLNIFSFLQIYMYTITQ